MRTALGYLTEATGFGLIVVASYRVSLTLALAVAGVVLIVAAQAAGRR